MANIQFNNIKEIGLPIGAMPVGVDGLTEDLIAENGGIINAVQIDWNGAVVGTNKTLNTTSDVLLMLKEAYDTAKDAQPKGNYLTSIPDEYVTETELSKKGYLTSIPDGYVTETELNTVIKTLSDRITALENNKIYEVKSVTLDNLTCAPLSSAKTLPASGGTFTITANNGYSLPNDVTVTGATSSWNKSTGVLTISNVTGEVTVSAKGVINKPTSIKIYNAAGTSELSTAQITGTDETVQIKVKVTGTNILSTQSKFKVTTIPSGITIKNGSTSVTTTSELSTDTVLTISGKAKMSATNLVVTSTSNTSLTDTLSVTVNDGSVTKVDITTTDTKTSTYKGGNVAISLSVSKTMFGTPTIEWSCDGGTLQNTSVSGATFVAPENTTTSDKVYTITAKYNDTLKDSMTVTVPGKVESYTWHLSGPATEAQITRQSYINGLTYNQTDKPSTITLKKGYNPIIIPSSWTTPTFGLVSDFSKRYTPFTADDLGITNPSNKKVLVLYTEVENGICYVKWS